MTNVCQNKDDMRSIQVLKEDRVVLADAIATYRLCENRFAGAEYYIEILYEKERAAARVGEDADAAHALYESVVCGTVTPCTLADIVQDAAYCRYGN